MAYYRKVPAKKSSKGYTWSVTVDIGRDDKGKRKQTTKRGFATKKDAEKYAAQVQHEINMDTFIVDSGMKLKEYLEKWVELYCKRKLRDTTIKSYQRAIDFRILPVIGEKQLSQLTPPYLQVFVNGLVDEGLSPRYVEYISGILYGALDKAVEWDLMRKNPMSRVDVPRARRSQKVTWSVEEVNTFLTVGKFVDIDYATAIEICLDTGVRRGELLAIKWDDIDWENQTIRIDESLVYDDEGFRFGTTKNESSKRSIKCTSTAFESLRKHRVRQNEMKIYFGNQYKDHNLVFCREDGQPIYPRTLTTIFNRMIKKANVPKIRIHDIRHTHATLFLESGGTMKELQQRLGHASMGTTSDVYAHVTEKMKKRSTENYEEYMKKRS
ncbi:tyrosine-type recombinase/integrase [Terribacillus sp. JSM ZJ617]|uniref:tyrosine-type recombinase/integrase n=1 Tax=Terribacillus sp. JSM ZJ617 TaxID=3342119 RepID=UPI0035A97C37